MAIHLARGMKVALAPIVLAGTYWNPSLLNRKPVRLGS